MGSGVPRKDMRANCRAASEAAKIVELNPDSSWEKAEAP